MTLNDALMLSDALTQFIDNTDDVPDEAMANKLALAQFWLDQADQHIAGLAA